VGTSDGLAFLFSGDESELAGPTSRPCGRPGAVQLAERYDAASKADRRRRPVANGDDRRPAILASAGRPDGGRAGGRRPPQSDRAAARPRSPRHRHRPKWRRPAAVLARFRVQELAVRSRVLSYVTRSWDGLTDYRDADIDRFVAAVVPVVAGGQVRAASLTDAYLAQVETAVLGTPTGPVGVPLEIATGARGVDPAEVYRRPAARALHEARRRRRLHGGTRRRLELEPRSSPSATFSWRRRTPPAMSSTARTTSSGTSGSPTQRV
jgi:hypothetical protein